ncbi:MAG: ATP-binding protein [Planctomycetes bacterium]|nr:ATP-binding protein [Planctomycetota bacterium]
MVPRLITPVVGDRLRQYPAVALVGPRQCGKTTLARSLGGEYFDLEQQTDRLRLDLQWEKLAAGNSLVILDEAQAWPEVFDRLRGAIDQRRRMGRFLLLGSVSPALMTQVSESLAGRLSVVEIAPFTYGELPTKAARNRHWLCGGYPDGGVLAPRKYSQWQLDYLALLSQRDLPNWGLPAKPQVTERLLRMLAAMHGQIWNASQIGQSLGLSYHTVNGYLDYLIGAFLIRRLSPYHVNVGKRLVKSPKLYWRDSGLLHALLGVHDAKGLLDQPWVGASWEGYVIEQVLNAIQQRDRVCQAYFHHVSGQHEIDLVLDFGSEVWAIEVKLTASPQPQDLRRLDRAADEIRAQKRILVSQARDVIEGNNQISCNLPWLLMHLKQRPA